MPGFNQTQLQNKVQNANSVIVLLGDQPLAFAQTVSPSIDFGTEGLYGIGTAQPQEIQQMRDSMTIAIDKFALTSLGDELTSNGTPLFTILANNQVNISVTAGTDQGTSASSMTVLYTYVGCVAQNLNTTIGANRPLTEAVTFMALDVIDSDGNSIMSGQNAITVN